MSRSILSHAWRNGDTCVRCGLRREGAGAGRCGAMRYYRDGIPGEDYRPGPCIPPLALTEDRTEEQRREDGDA